MGSIGLACQQEPAQMLVSPDCVNFYFSCWSGTEIIRLCRLWKQGQGLVGALRQAL